MKHDKDKLSLRQELFCSEYTVDFNGKRAAIAAGYAAGCAEVTASKLLRLGKVQKKLDQFKEKIEKKVGIDAEWVLRQAVKAHQMCMGEMGGKFDSTGALKALDIIGKHVSIQAFKDKMELSGVDGEPLEAIFNINFISPVKSVE